MAVFSAALKFAGRSFTASAACFALLSAYPMTASQSSAAQACLPPHPRGQQPTPSAVEEHLALRGALGEVMPQGQTMVMLHGKGGHLATEEYSIVLVRSPRGDWHGTAVGRSRIWVEDANFMPTKKAEWTLDDIEGSQLDEALTRECSVRGEASPPSDQSGSPPRGYISETIDVLAQGRNLHTFYASEDGAALAALLRPPQAARTSNSTR